MTHVPYDPQALGEALLARCERLVDMAKSAGAHEAEAFASASNGVSVKYEKGDLKLVSSDEGAVVGLRVFRDKRAGFASTNQAHDEALSACVRDALATESQTAGSCGFVPNAL